jgi:hypothetical protein
VALSGNDVINEKVNVYKYFTLKFRSLYIFKFSGYFITFQLLTMDDDYAAFAGGKLKIKKVGDGVESAGKK